MAKEQQKKKRIICKTTTTKKKKSQIAFNFDTSHIKALSAVVFAIGRT